MGIYRTTVKLAFATGSKGGTNTWHIRSTSVPLPGAPTMVTAIKNFYDAIKAMFPTTMTFAWDGTLAQVDSADPPVLGGGTPWTVTGTATGSLYSPAGVGCVVGWKSSIATRSGRGRTFLAPLAQGVMQSDGSLADTNLATMQTAANALISTSLADGNGAITVWSPTQNVARDIVSAKINDRVAWLSTRRGR